MRSTGSSQIPPSPGPSVRRPVASARRRKVSRPTSTAGGGGSSKSPRGTRRLACEHQKESNGFASSSGRRSRYTPATGTVASVPRKCIVDPGRRPSWRAVCWVTHAPAAGPPPCTRVTWSSAPDRLMKLTPVGTSPSAVTAVADDEKVTIGEPIAGSDAVASRTALSKPSVTAAWSMVAPIVPAHRASTCVACAAFAAEDTNRAGAAAAAPRTAHPPRTPPTTAGWRQMRPRALVHGAVRSGLVIEARATRPRRGPGRGSSPRSCGPAPPPRRGCGAPQRGRRPARCAGPGSGPAAPPPRRRCRS